MPSRPTAPGAVPVALTPATALALQRTIGNANVTRLAIARQEDATAEAFEGYFGEIVTYEDLAQNFRLGSMMIKEGMEGVDPESDLGKEAAEHADGVMSWANFYIKGGSKPLPPGSIEDLRYQLEAHQQEIAETVQKLQYAKDAPKRAALKKSAEEAKAVAREVEKLAPKIADTARAAFKSGDESLLAQVANIAGNVTDIGLGIHELARETSEKLAATKGVSLPAVGKYVSALNALNKGLAALNLALSMTGEKGKTKLDEGINGINFAAGAFSALGTLGGLPAHIGLYSNLYLVPLTQACLAGVARIGELTHEKNKTWVELFGAPGNYFVEPGGEPMWQYMVKVMKTKDSKLLPDPPKEVAEYFMEHRDAFNAGVGATSSLSRVPTTGTIWKELDTTRFKPWVRNNRKAIWAMLYGSMKVPSKV